MFTYHEAVKRKHRVEARNHNHLAEICTVGVGPHSMSEAQKRHEPIWFLRVCRIGTGEELFTVEE